ncbi:MAG: AAA family ATPase, partial [Acidimicrobiales bacterium]
MAATVSDSGGPASSLPEGTVTVLFTDLVDSTNLNQRYGDEVANTVRRDLEQLALACVERNRGHVVKELGDGLMVAFQSARRAVTCAREIQLGVKGRSAGADEPRPTMRIGLHTGEVITEDGDLHGETVIIAKRIEGVAPPGGILASETVRGVLGTARSELIDRGEFELKGIDEPWRLYEIPVPIEHREPTVAGMQRSPFVGRVRETAVISDVVAQAREGHGGVLLVSGEAGAGKSRIVFEAASMARNLDLAVLTGHCVEMEAPVPYQPVVEQLEQTARALSPEEFRQILGENAPEVARLMPELQRVYDDIGPTPNLPADQERRYLLHGLGQFVERAARRRPIVLSYEDLHWADEASLLLIESLVRMAAELPLLIIGTYRPGEVSPRDRFARTLEELTRQRLATELHLGPLSEVDVAQLLAGRAGSQAPPEFVRLVYDETEGNPFFVEEV